MAVERERSIEDVIRSDGRYPPEAYAFLHEGMARAAKTVHGEEVIGAQRHVTGQQICQACREMAVERYGQLARTVLNRWNVRSTMDLGNMVYLLIENKFMKKTEEDSLEDFRNVYDFEEAFRLQDEFELKE